MSRVGLKRSVFSRKTVHGIELEANQIEIRAGEVTREKPNLQDQQRHGRIGVADLRKNIWHHESRENALAGPVRVVPIRDGLDDGAPVLRPFHFR